MAYNKAFAGIYDSFMDSFGYEELAEYICTLIDKFKRSDSNLMVDLGCGTGTLTGIMKKKGYDLIGIDNSEEMLNIARETTDSEIMYLCQDMTDFELYGTVDVIICSTDCVNYILDKRDLNRMMKWINNYLEYGGVFIMDINTPYKLKNVIGNNVFCDEREDAFYTWENYFDSKSNLCEFVLNIFTKKENGDYERSTDTHIQRAYSPEEIVSSAEKAGLETVAVYADKSFKKVKEDTQRVFFVFRRKSK